MDEKEIENIRAKIREHGHQWSAGATSISKLPIEQRKTLLGDVIDEEEIDRMTAALVKEDTYAAEKEIAFAYPSAWNWKNVNGRNWTTSVKDQNPCGSCVGFGVVATVESNLKIFKRNHLLNPDLSEADVFFCSCSNCCTSGLDREIALSYVRDKGVPDEKCFPYTPKNQPCNPCSDRAKRIIKIQGWRKICNVSQAKEWIARKGPLVGSMVVYEDFVYYRGGIYKHISGKALGGHCISIVGYNDVEGYWICKNSWGPSWGENGWFKIAYGECEIGVTRCFWTAEFPSISDDIIVPENGRVQAKFKSKDAAFINEFWIYKPGNKLIFKATDAEVNKTFPVGNFRAGERLIFALKTPDGNIYYTDHSLNKDACDHVNKVQTGKNKWELRWEDIYGLGDRDYNDLIVEIEVL